MTSLYNIQEIYVPELSTGHIIEESTISDNVGYVMDMWENVQKLPIFRNNLEMAEYMIESSGILHRIYDTLDNIIPLDTYSDVIELASVMMVLIQPIFSGHHTYEYAFNLEKLSEMYSDPFMHITYIKCAMDIINSGIVYNAFVVG